MKTIKEKARAYDERLERAKNEYRTHKSFNGFCEMLVRIFPELREDEDENVRKALINIFSTHKDYEIFFGVSVENIVAWLKKQGQVKESEIPELIKETSEENNNSVTNNDWNEEDRTMAFTLMRDVDQMSYISKEGKNERIGWLNSLDEKFASIDSTWSKEDEINLYEALSYIKDDTLKEFIKSLKYQKRWKPSDEQMNAFEQAYNWYNTHSAQSLDLNSLYYDLKKLK